MQYEPVFVARQPIYDDKQEIWAYELLFRHNVSADGARFLDGDQATAKVIVDGFSLATEGMPEGRRVFINFPRKLLLQEAALSLPSQSCVVEVLETVEPEPEILDALAKLKAAGYMLALDDFVGQPGYEPLVEATDIIKVDFLGGAPDEIIKWVQNIKHLGKRILAEKIEDIKRFQLAKALGATLFQGYYFSKPQLVQGRTLSQDGLTRLRLMEKLSDHECEVEELSQIIGQNLQLSFRLLRFINSSAMSLRSRVSSITQAVALMGLNPLKRWIMVVLLSDVDSGPRGQDLTFLSLQRARLLEQIAQTMPKPPAQPETMFLLGLFSKLDALLGLEMTAILKDMPLQDFVRDGLTGVDNEGRKWLDFIEALEWSEYDVVDRHVAERNLDHRATARIYLESQAWAQNILGQVHGCAEEE